MSYALGVLKWSPEVFWNSTVSELISASEGHAAQFKTPGQNPLKKEELEDLMNRFPDDD